MVSQPGLSKRDLAIEISIGLLHRTGKAHKSTPTTSLSVVVSCKDEEEVLDGTHRRLTSVLARSGLSFEVIYVDDGGADSTSDRESLAISTH